MADAPGIGQDDSMRPMLATKGTHVPPGPEWVHEVKWDGVRMLTEVRSPTRTAGCACGAATATT